MMDILRILETERQPITLTRLTQKVNTCYASLRNAVNFLAERNLVEIKTEKIRKMTVKKAKITEKGKEILQEYLKMITLLGGEKI